MSKAHGLACELPDGVQYLIVSWLPPAVAICLCKVESKFLSTPLLLPTCKDLATLPAQKPSSFTMLQHCYPSSSHPSAAESINHLSRWTRSLACRAKPRTTSSLLIQGESIAQRAWMNVISMMGFNRVFHLLAQALPQSPAWMTGVTQATGPTLWHKPIRMERAAAHQGRDPADNNTAGGTLVKEAGGTALPTEAAAAGRVGM
jgi:hypothetical protein